MNFLTIGIPNGSLYKATKDLFKKIGIQIITDGRCSQARIMGSQVFNRALILRPQDISLMINTGIIDFLNKIRIKKAENMLLYSDCKITGIALTVGFSDTSYFNRLFKKFHGITPGQYREQGLNQTTSIL